MRSIPVRLPDRRAWLRVADPDWAEPLDPSYAQAHGGRWNPPGSFPTLYLSGDVATARLQIERLLAGSPVRPDDLDDGAYVLVAARLPRSQVCADAVTGAGLRSLALPVTYPLDARGEPVGHGVCQVVGARVREESLRGVWCRSAGTADGQGRELAWFPATRRPVARPVWESALPFGEWRHARTWTEIGLPEQASPS